MNNFLILKPGAIGDLLQLTPVIRQIKKAYPNSKISILVSNSATKSLFVNNPYIDKINIYDKKGEHKKFRDFLTLCKEIKKVKFDVVLNFQRSNLKLWLMTLLLKPSMIAVYNKDESKHAVLNHLETLTKLNIAIEPDDLNLELFLDDDSERFADKFFEVNKLNDKTVIALNPGASHKVNRWPAKYFSELAQMIENQLKARCIIIGGREDTYLAEEINKNTSSSLINLAGKINLLQLGAILKRCKVLITGDTGPMHIATAVGTKVIALFGAADPKRTGPVGKSHIVLQAKDVKCLPCRKRVCNNSHYLECMEKITPNDVFEKILEVIR